MNKTAMQQLIEQLEELQKTKGVGYWVIDAAKALLPTEKQQIEDAWLEGSHNGGVLGASEYYSLTYQTTQ